MTDSLGTLYYTQETASDVATPPSDLWGDTKARTLDGAQKSAMTRKMFAPSAVWIGMEMPNGEIKAVSVRREMPPHGVSLGWEDVA